MMLERNHRRNCRSFENLSSKVASGSRRRGGLTTRGLLALSAAVATGVFSAERSRADVFGNNGGLDLSQSTSWTDETVPAVDSAPPGINDIARFDSNSAGGTFTLDVATSWLGISLINPTAAVTIGSAADATAGGALTLGASGIDMSVATQNLTFGGDPVSLSANQTWNVASGRTLTFTGSTLNLNTGTAATLTLAGAGNVSFNATTDVISGTGGNIVKYGTGTLTLGALNTYTGSTTVNNGTLSLMLNTIVNNTSAPPGSVNALSSSSSIIGGGGTILLTGGASPSGDPAWVQTVSSLNASAGATTFNESRGSSARVILTLSNLNTRSVGSVVNFVDSVTSAGANSANSGGYRAPTSAEVNGIIPYVTYTTTTSGTQTGGLASNNPLASSWYVPAGTTNDGTAYSAFNVSTATTLGTSSSSNVDVTTSVAVPLGTTVNTLRFNSGNSNTLTVTPGDVLTVAAGGILITGAYTTHQGHITGGTLEGGNPGSGSANDLIIIDYEDPAQGSNAKFTIDSVIADNNANATPGPTALTKSGIGLLVLTNTANTYSGLTYIDGGTINIAGEGSSFGSLGVVPTSVVPNDIILSSGTIQLGASFNLNSNRGITLADKGGGFDTNGFASTYSGNITGSGPFNKAGANTLRLTSANTYTGNTTVSAGTLSAVNTIGSATGTGNVTVGALAILSGSGKISGGVTLATGAISGQGGNLAPGDNGVGNITVGALTLNAGSAIDIELASDTSYDTVTVGNGITINAGVGSVSPGVDLYNVGTTNPYSSIGSHTYNISSYSGPITGLSNLIWANQVIGFNYNFSSVSTGVNSGILQMNISGAPASITSAWNTAANNQNWSVSGNWTAGVPHAAGDSATFGVVSGQSGAITVNLDAAESVSNLTFNNSTNSYTILATTGSLTFDTGVPGTVANLTDLGGSHTITAPTTLNSSVMITTTNPTDLLTLNGNINGSGGVTVGAAAGTGTYGTVVMTGSNTYAGNTIISPGNTLQLGSTAVPGSGNLGGTNLTDNGTFVINRNNALTFAGNITGSGSLVQAGVGGITTLSGSNGYLGTTNISGGTLQIGSANAFPGGTLIIGSAGTLDMNGFNVSTSSLSGSGVIDNVTPAVATTLTVNGSTSTTYSGVIRNTNGTIGVTVQGSGTLILANTNTYSGQTNLLSGGLTIPTGAVIATATNRAALNVGSQSNTSTMIINGTFTASSATISAIGTTVLNVSGGTLNVTGTLSPDTGSATTLGTGVLDLVSGTINANAVAIGRTQINYGTTIQTAGNTTDGIYVLGGTLNVTGALGVDNGNSTNTMRVDGGTVNVGGTTDISTVTTTGRYSLLDLNGGTFNSTDATVGGGIVIGGGINNGTSPYGELLVRGTALVNTNAISFGTSNQSSGSGSEVFDFMSGTVYVGANGINQYSTSSLIPQIYFGSSTAATSPILAASASWTSTMTNAAITLTNSSANTLPTIQTANASGGAENITINSGLSGSGGLNVTGAGVLTLGGNNFYSGVTNVSGGTLTIASTGLLNSSTLTVFPGATLNFNGAGANNFGLNSGSTLTSNGTTTFGGNMGSGSPAVAQISNLIIGSTGNVLLADAGVGNRLNRTVLQVTSNLSFGGTTGAWTGKLDLTSNDMIVQNGNLAAVTNQVAQGYNHGTWQGSAGITSSTAAADTGHLTALGVIQNDDGTGSGQALYGSFDNQNSGDSDILVKYTYYGDTNLDGKVDGSDYSRIDAAFLADKSHPGSMTGWFNGDFNYDGVINGSDYTLIDNAFNTQGAQIADQFATATSEIALSGTSAVPEPASLGLLAIGATGLLGRRKRRI